MFTNNKFVLFLSQICKLLYELFVGNLHGMCSKKSRYKWSPRQPPMAVKISSLFYLCPAMISLTVIPGKMGWEFWLWVVVAMNSTASDCLCAGVESKWHIADRISSYMVGVITVGKYIYICSGDMPCDVWEWSCFLGALILIFVPAAKCLTMARDAETYEKWSVYHFCWHMFSASAVVICMYVEYLRESGR